MQHGASTLPNEAFGEFPKVGTLEVHLATGFQNLALDGGHFPPDLKDEVRRWCIENLAAERSEKDSEEQFVYKARKKMWGPFKQQVWNLPTDAAQGIGQDLQNQFEFLMDQLGATNTKDLVAKAVNPVQIDKPMPESLKAATKA